MKTIGEKIQILREERNLKQKELAELAGITEATLSRYENGKREPKGEIISKLANVLNVSTDYLLGRNDIITSSVEPTGNLAEQVGLKLIKELEKDGYKIEEKDLPNLILAAKITLAQNKKNQDD
ncbi:helix-turn-helix domain-containing protein [Clostridium beijerinckii]|jgi:Helix-turn-helix.|uniref:Helix-turn-helix transcriptional regulator n=2 Tax=Clostridium beijerinckii TaxID=1520 RepID=A0AAE2RX67_CLOBE|nr:helix-turn-helix transcriptional regulator [Clostridium beijerinckii]ABR33789.1 helix-turn-helix domain protein [Clostridium beijerinckii NCIMB 8052]AIU02550.1 helix-turn-helix domain-containing protein [Clostridium beijerinckii ATCC 35702]MBF7812211.1 helix-turn-helix transcriptional regulator [Clostridium beijerinckii]NRT24928.1 transcriptional regulator with XRE-family HTH domain [Clostridium beijerinckii]NRT67479.1 transcriptional regulator with XRE-family HTH domain [Clostridium beijer